MFILASASVARRELLKGFRFKVVPSGVSEVRRKTLRDTVLATAPGRVGPGGRHDDRVRR
jgi:predicted house-cleaning NTP pyrophosphatase (Maf/HAM1 superfamily)